MDKEIVKQLIGNKKPTVAEIELTLFENCDVNCAFCGHDKKSVVGMSIDEMLQKMDSVAAFLDQIDDDIEDVHLHLVGGELLQDRLVDSGYLDHYETLIKKYDALCKSRSIETKVIFVSNMLTRRQEAVLQFFDKINESVSMKFIASYDLAGRPINDQYKANLNFFKNYIANINVVVTKQAIRKLISGDKYFEHLYQNFEIFMDDFLPDEWTQKMIPSDEEYFQYLMCVKDRYPNLMPYGDAIDKVLTGQINEIQFTTFNKCTILPDGRVTNYLWSRHKPELFRVLVNYEDNSNMLWNFMEENGCLSCEYYQSCPLRCPVSYSWKGVERTECVNKRLFDCVTNSKV